MSYIWIKFFALVALLQFIEIVKSYPANNDSISVTDNIELTRYKRQINSIDSRAKNLIVLAIVTLMCSSPPPSEEKRKGCKVNVKNLPSKQALIVDPDDHTKFLYPDENGDIYFEETGSVFLSCPGSTFDSIPTVPFGTFTCVCEDTFEFDDKLYKFNKLSCRNYPESAIKGKGKIDHVQSDVESNSISTVQYRKYEIGFVTDSNKFLNIITVFYYNNYVVPWYAKSVISKNHKGRQKNSKNSYPSRWKKTYCCNNKYAMIDYLYKVDTQDITFKSLLFSHTLGREEDRYLKKDTKLYVFNRGHLTPKSSLIYLAERRATFAYLNAAPQWSIINDGNWARTEEYIIEMAETLRHDLTVYTGVYKVLELKDTADGDTMKPIYLYATKERENIIRDLPVPLYFFKFVVDLESEKGVVFVTVNNPYIEDPAQYHICDNPMIKKDGVKMPNWRIDEKTNKPDIKLGYSYMCTVIDFVTKSGTIPENLSDLYGENSLLYIPDAIHGLPIAPEPSTSKGNKDLRQKQDI